MPYGSIFCPYFQKSKIYIIVWYIILTVALNISEGYPATIKYAYSMYVMHLTHIYYTE